MGSLRARPGTFSPYGPLPLPVPLPEQVLTSEDLLRHVTESSRLPLPPRVFERSTGIVTRRVAATGARVLAGALDAPFIRGASPEPEAVHTASEHALHERITAGFADAEVPPLKHAPVDVELRDGDTLDGWTEPVRVLHVPGHTSGSIALHFTESSVLFSGDTIATEDGRAILGPFNLDRQQAIASFRRMAALDVEKVCVPHGLPLLENAGAVLRAATPENDWV
ncbi:MBL fold metallo-hydrolase [Streptomyces sp. NPDC002476]|uniref:MBL fold metallo-hydrolase n=1 Tax=Streptomyces sp. NPDC002476 TaxID=3364648 RepID=UPI0036920CA9